MNKCEYDYVLDPFVIYRIFTLVKLDVENRKPVKERFHTFCTCLPDVVIS